MLRMKDRKDHKREKKNERERDWALWTLASDPTVGSCSVGGV